MDIKAIYKFCKELDCCDACCLRYLGIKSPSAFENASKFVRKYQDSASSSVDQESTDQDPSNQEIADQKLANLETAHQEQADQGAVYQEAPHKEPANQDSIKEYQNGVDKAEGNGTDDDGPPVKRYKSSWSICRCCLGILQEHTWADSCRMVQQMLDKKKYSCGTFACGLSSPMAILLREKAIALLLADAFPSYDPKTITALKEAWKWSFGEYLAARVGKTLDSGAVSPLLVTLNLEYPDDLQELEILKTVSPSVFEERSKERKRFGVEFTRRSVEQALAAGSASVEALRSAGRREVNVPAACVSVVGCHAPVYLGGRYIKLSRELPQTPWLVGGKRIMESSVQEIIFEPIAKLCGLESEEVEHRLKMISAGREDVDVRCLGDGRPFAVEITDPRRDLTEQELQEACDVISSSGKVIVKRLVHVSKDDLAELKKGEETKCKTYEILCIKLAHCERDARAKSDSPITVTAEDIANINAYRNTPEGDAARIQLTQRTPIRVLHRRPLLTRTRKIYDLTAAAVPGYPQLLCVRLRTDAGTYVKEWAHGELRRTRPSLRQALGAPADVLALDVTSIALSWPGTH